MAFAILLDRSGSMGSVMDEVRTAAHGFIDGLPGRAECLVGAFDDEASFSPDDGFGRNACIASNFSLDGLVAGGTTDLYSPLRSVYRHLNHNSYSSHQRAVIIVTDGQVNEEQGLAAQVQSLKGDIPTFVLFLGDEEQQWLEGLADNYLEGSEGIEGVIGEYFEVVADAYSNQTVMRASPCGPASPSTGAHSGQP